MKRVVVLKSNLQATGGLEKYTKWLASAFSERRCAVTVLTTGEVESGLPFTVHSLCETSKFTFRHLLRFDQLCVDFLERHLQPHIIFGMERNHFQTHYRAGSGVHLAFLQRRKLIEPFWKGVSFSMNPLHRLLLRLEKEAFENPKLEKLFTNSQMVKEEILSYYRVDEKRISVVHNGIDWKSCTIQARDPQSPFHFLFVGNDYKRKGLFFLLKGMRDLKEDYVLTVVGKCKNLPYYQKLAKKWKIPARFLGAKSDLAPYYDQADALVIPSLYDPFANVTLEALARGLFVVTSAMNGGKEVLTPKTGVVIASLFDADSVKEALLQAFLHPKTKSSAAMISKSVRHLDFSNQLNAIVKESLC